MAKFSTKPAARSRSEGRERVCLYVDKALYRQLKALCVLKDTNISQWFDKHAAADVSRHPGLTG